MNAHIMYKKLLWRTVISVWIVLGLHMLAMKFYLYWTFDWFDVLMHGLGGLAVGFFAAALLARFTRVAVQHRYFFLFSVITLTLFVGFLWEGFEFALDIYMQESLHQPSVGDTMSDLGMDMLGGLIAGLTALGLYKKYE